MPVWKIHYKNWTIGGTNLTQVQRSSSYMLMKEISFEFPSRQFYRLGSQVQGITTRAEPVPFITQASALHLALAFRPLHIFHEKEMPYYLQDHTYGEFSLD